MIWLDAVILALYPNAVDLVQAAPNEFKSASVPKNVL